MFFLSLGGSSSEILSKIKEVPEPAAKTAKLYNADAVLMVSQTRLLQRGFIDSLIDPLECFCGIEG